MELPDLITELESRGGNPAHGLPDEVFRLVSRFTPLVNVDLLIRNDAGQTLLTWRHDEYCGPGWHVPGGIIRFKEKIADRIAAVAAGELGAAVRFAAEPVAMHEVFAKSRDTRGHFISLLYRCELATPPDAALAAADAATARHGQWAWHTRCPDNMIGVHAIYRQYIDAPRTWKDE